MARRRDIAGGRPQAPRPGAAADGNAGPADSNKDKTRAAFDTWLDDGLHKMFDRIADEPVPEELLRLIQSDRPKGDAGKG